MRILAVSVVFPPAWCYGGTPFTAHSVAKTLIRQGHDVLAITTGDGESDHVPVLDRETIWDDVPVIYCSRRKNVIPFYAPDLAQTVAHYVPTYHVATIRSSWTHVGPTAANECRRRHMPYLAYPEGNFDAWAMQRGRLKKRAFWLLYDRAYFRGAAAIVALTAAEADDIRRMGLTNRIEVIPNGINPEIFDESATRSEIETHLPRLRGRRWVLYLGRLHPKKGLTDLISAFSAVRRTCPDALLVIAGFDEGGYRRILERQIAEAQMQESVALIGPVEGKRKAGLLKESEMLALPSYSEGFPFVVLEALACGLPVVLSAECHIPEVSQVGAGIELPHVASSLAQGMIELLSDARLRREMSEQGLRLVRERFSLEQVGSMTADLCRQVA